MKKILLILLFSAFVIACGQNVQTSQQDEWEVLFDGENMKAWRSFNNKSLVCVLTDH